MHWNFFITLGLLPPFVTLLRILKWKRLPYSVFAAIIIGGYQWAMYNVGIRGYSTIIEFVVKSERTDLFNQNREGIFSFLGTRRNDKTNDRISINISCGNRYLESNTAGIAARVLQHSISTDQNIRLAYHQFGSVDRSITIDRHIYQNPSQSSLRNSLTLTFTNEGKSSVRTLDSIVQHDLPSRISRRSNDILPESKYSVYGRCPVDIGCV